MVSARPALLLLGAQSLTSGPIHCHFLAPTNRTTGNAKSGTATQQPSSPACQDLSLTRQKQPKTPTAAKRLAGTTNSVRTSSRRASLSFLLALCRASLSVLTCDMSRSVWPPHSISKQLARGPASQIDWGKVRKYDDATRKFSAATLRDRWVSTVELGFREVTKRDLVVNQDSESRDERSRPRGVAVETTFWGTCSPLPLSRN